MRCYYCDQQAVTAVLVRVGELADPYQPVGPENKDLSRLMVVRACEAHRDQLRARMQVQS